MPSLHSQLWDFLEDFCLDSGREWLYSQLIDTNIDIPTKEAYVRRLLGRNPMVMQVCIRFVAEIELEALFWLTKHKSPVQIPKSIASHIVKCYMSDFPL